MTQPSPPAASTNDAFDKSKWTEKVQAISSAVSAGAVIVALYFAVPQLSLIEAELEEKNEQQARLREPRPAVTGNVLSTGRVIESDGKQYLEISLVATVSNSGDYPIEIGSLDCRLYRAAIDSVVDVAPVQPLTAQAVRQVGGIEPPKQEIGFLNSRGEAWVPAGDFSISPEWGSIPSWQERHETFYVVVSHCNPDEMLRAEITLNPAEGSNWTPLTWSGFVGDDQSMCIEGGFSAGFGGYSAAEDAPPGPTDAARP